MGQQDLIDAAVRKAGSNAALARLLGKAPPRITNWRKGVEPVPDDVIAALARYIGEDPITTLARSRGGLWEKVSTGFESLLLYAITSWRRSVAG